MSWQLATRLLLKKKAQADIRDFLVVDSRGATSAAALWQDAQQEGPPSEQAQGMLLPSSPPPKRQVARLVADIRD